MAGEHKDYSHDHKRSRKGEGKSLDVDMHNRETDGFVPYIGNVVCYMFIY